MSFILKRDNKNGKGIQLNDQQVPAVEPESGLLRAWQHAASLGVLVRNFLTSKKENHISVSHKFAILLQPTKNVHEYNFKRQFIC